MGRGGGGEASLIACRHAEACLSSLSTSASVQIASQEAQQSMQQCRASVVPNVKMHNHKTLLPVQSRTWSAECLHMSHLQRAHA